MFRKVYNQAMIKAAIEPDGPILVVQGGHSLDPAAPDLSFVRSMRRGIPTVYLPGSSLKGVMRAHAERILVTSIGPSAAEDPFDHRAPRRRTAHSLLGKSPSGVYAASCEADKLFGSTEIASRLRVADAFPVASAEPPKTETRYGVAINRAKQSVQVGPFEQEAVTEGRFALAITLENFELWMLTLTLQVLRDMDDGLVQIGHAKSRGFGSVRVCEPQVEIRYPGNAPNRLLGASACEKDGGTRKQFGLFEPDTNGALTSVDWPDDGEIVTRGLFSGRRWQGWDAGVGGLLDVLGSESWPSFLDLTKEAPGS